MVQSAANQGSKKYDTYLYNIQNEPYEKVIATRNRFARNAIGFLIVGIILIILYFTIAKSNSEKTGLLIGAMISMVLSGTIAALYISPSQSELNRRHKLQQIAANQ